MNNWFGKHIRGIVIGAVLLIAVVGVSLSARAIDGETVEAVATLQGTVAAKDISVNTTIPGRIAEFYVEEGQVVNAGDPIVKISSEELEAKKLQVEAQIDQAEAGVEASEAVLEMAEANYELALDRIEQAQAGVDASLSQRDMASAVNDKAENGARTQQVAQAEAAYNLYEATYERALVLYEGGAISLQKLEEIETQKEIYAQTLDMAIEGARTEDKEAASAQLSLTEAGVAASNAVLEQAIEASNIALSQVTQAQAGLTASQGVLDQAKAGLLEIQVYLDKTTIYAPIDGTVTALNSDEGELVSTGSSIGTVSNLDNCWVTVDVDEDELGSLMEGQSVKVNLLAFEGESFTGTVSTINSQADFAVTKATNENGNFDIVSYGVKIELDNADSVIRPGMTAIVDFDSMDVMN